MTDLISAEPQDKMLVRLFCRSAGMIIIHTRMSREALDKEIWGEDRKGVLSIKGTDEFDNAVDVRFDRADIVGHTACKLASGKIAQVQAELAGHPSRR